jgi:hypothetical protein
MEFEDAVRRCVDMLGKDVARDPRRLVSSLLDYADDSLALRAAARNLDDAALAPFVEALDAGEAGAFASAAARAEAILRNERGLSEGVAHDIASALGSALSGALAPQPKQEAYARGDRAYQARPARPPQEPVEPVDRPTPSPVSPQRPQGTASQPPSQAHVQSSVPAPKGSTFLGHDFWWWYRVSWILLIPGGILFMYIPVLSLLTVPWSLLSLWALFVKLPVFLFKKYGTKKKA